MAGIVGHVIQIRKPGPHDVYIPVPISVRCKSDPDLIGRPGRSNSETVPTTPKDSPVSDSFFLLIDTRFDFANLGYTFFANGSYTGRSWRSRFFVKAIDLL